MLADGEAGGARGAQTFVLIANTSPTPGRVRLTVLPEHAGVARLGRHADRRADRRPAAEQPHDRADARRSRASRDTRFGVLVESIDTAPLAQLVVERAMYWNAGGEIWAAGTNLLAHPTELDRAWHPEDSRPGARDCAQHEIQ